MSNIFFNAFEKIMKLNSKIIDENNIIASGDRVWYVSSNTTKRPLVLSISKNPVKSKSMITIGSGSYAKIVTERAEKNEKISVINAKKISSKEWEKSKEKQTFELRHCRAFFLENTTKHLKVW